MEQYWINRNGQQSGPYEFEQLKDLQLDGKTYLWYNGLEDWTQLEKLPELAAQLTSAEPPTIPPVVTPTEKTPEAHDVLDKPEQPDANDAFTPDVPTVPPVAAPTPPAIPVPQGIPTGIPMGVPMGAPVAPQPQAAHPIPMPAATTPPNADEAKCPPTNLVWAIITAVLCCAPLSVVAIFMAFKVKRCWGNGEVEKAKKWSDRGAWMIIASIIAGILVQPILMLISSAI